MTGGRPVIREALARYRSRRADAVAARRNRAEASRCFFCGVAFADGGPLARTADHRVPRAAGGTDGLANLVFVCLACNQRKADQAEATFVASAWLADRRRAVADGRLADDR